jgi:hypothetical protein
MSTRLSAYFRGWEVKECSWIEHPGVGNQAVLDALITWTARVAAGSPWLWAREEMANSVEVLFVDEAGQMSLANVLAVSRSNGSTLPIHSAVQVTSLFVRTYESKLFYRTCTQILECPARQPRCWRFFPCDSARGICLFAGIYRLRIAYHVQIVAETTAQLVWSFPRTVQDSGVE